MKAIEFIEEDLHRGKFARRAVTNSILVLGVALAPMMLGLGMRSSLAGAFAPRVLAWNLLAAALLGMAAVWGFRNTFSSRKVLAGCSAVLVLALAFAVERAVFPPGARTLYASPAIFWSESARCFWKGALAATFVGAWIIVFAFRFCSWPSRQWRGFLSMAAGTSGAVMLGFHCDSSSWQHVLAGHVAPGILIGLILFWIQERIFRLGLISRFPETFAAIRNPRRIG